MNSTYWLDKAADILFRSGSVSFYIGLSSTKPNADGTGITEPSGGGYQRVKIEAFSAPSSGSVSNVGGISFPTSTTEWFPVGRPATHWVVFDGSGSDAKMLCCGALSTSIIVSVDTVVQIGESRIEITLMDVSGST